MIRDAVQVAQLIGGIWFGDLSRSVTGSRPRSRVLLVVVGVMVVTWVAFAIATARGGIVGIPPRVQLQLLGELISGTSMAAGCAASMLLVLTPSGKELDAMLCSLPIRRGSSLLGRTAPPMLVAAVAAPIVMAPVLASSVRLVGPDVLGSIVAGTACGSLAGAAVVTVLIRALEIAMNRTGLPQPVITSIAAGTALGTAALAYASFSRSEWISSLPGRLNGQAWSAVALATIVFAAAATTLVLVVRYSPAEPTATLVRWLRSSRSAGSVSIDLLQTSRNPLLVSTLTLMGIAATAAALVTPSESPAWPSVMLVLVVTVPASTTLIAYGTNRRTLWIRSAIRTPVQSRYGGVKLLVCTLLSATALGVVALFGTVLGHAATTPWGFALPAALVATTASLLAGVHFPADLEMPGAPVVAFLEAAALTAVPCFVATKLPEPAPTLVMVGSALLYAALVPASISTRRRRSITA